MVRRNVYVTPSQIEFFLSLDTLTISEHIRRAIDEYIERLKITKVSASASKRKDQDEHNDSRIA